MLNFPPFPSGERGAGGAKQGEIKRRLLAILFGDHGSLGTYPTQAAREKINKNPFWLISNLDCIFSALCYS